MTFRLIKADHLLSLLLATTIINACATSKKTQVIIKDIKHLGGSFTAVCVEPNQVHLKSYYRFLTLKYESQVLRLKEQSRFKQISEKQTTKKTSNSSATRSHRLEKDQAVSESLNPPSITNSLQLNDSDPCPQVEAWVKLNPKSSLKMRWHDRTLMITPHQWHWGTETRNQLTQLSDISPMQFSNKNRDQRYLISSQYGLWTWKESQSHARSLLLPQKLPQNILSIAKDQGAWWLQTQLGNIQQLWPISLKYGQVKLIASPIKQKSSIKAQSLLAPLSGVALHGKVDGLVLKWGKQDYPFKALQSLCVLSKRLVVVATKEELLMLLGPHPAKARPTSSKQQLRVIKRMILPTKTKRILCENGRIFALGDGYGLLSLELEILNKL